MIGASMGAHAYGEPVIAISFGCIIGGVAGDSGGVGTLGGDSLSRVDRKKRRVGKECQ